MIFDIFEKLKKKTPTISAGPVEYIIAGLGNPGKQYEGTRHNAGFICLDALAASCGCRVERLKFKSLCGEAMVAEQKCLLLKPQTFMNNSGEAITEAMRFYQLPPERVLVLFDDISLEPGRLRIRRKGSDGGHNGIKSIIYLTGSDTFPRVKIGVGKKPHPQYDLADWVLGAFSPEQRKQLDEAAAHCTEAVRLIVSGQIEEAMNRFNS